MPSHNIAEYQLVFCPRQFGLLMLMLMFINSAGAPHLAWDASVKSLSIMNTGIFLLYDCRYCIAYYVWHARCGAQQAMVQLHAIVQGMLQVQCLHVADAISCALIQHC